MAARSASERSGGLTLRKGDELLPLHYPNADLNLDPFLLIEGHRNMPACEGLSVALIVRFVFVEAINEYLWTAFCQGCGDHEIGRAHV